MNKSGIAKIIKNLQVVTRKYQPEILTGIGIAGMITTTIMAVKATPKALDKIEEIKDEHKKDVDKKEYCKEIIVKVAPIYIPATIICGLSVSCLIGASSVNFKRNAALATAYTLSESALKEYQDKVVETIGPKKEEIIRSAVAKDTFEKEPVSSKEVYITEKGETLFYEPLSGRYFKSDIDSLRKMENELNRRMRDENYITLNEFYYEIGLPGTELGEIMEWDIDRGYIDLDFVPNKTPDDKPCFMVSHRVRPDYRYK